MLLIECFQGRIHRNLLLLNHRQSFLDIRHHIANARNIRPCVMLGQIIQIDTAIAAYGHQQYFRPHRHFASASHMRSLRLRNTAVPLPMAVMPSTAPVNRLPIFRPSSVR